VATFVFNLLIYWGDRQCQPHHRILSQVPGTRGARRRTGKKFDEAKLQALQMQLNPHFFFNTLHAISSLVHKDAEAADRMISRLSDLLRYTSKALLRTKCRCRRNSKSSIATLRSSKPVSASRLTVMKQIAPDALLVMCPTSYYSPFVENAIKHGIEPHARRGVINVSASRKEYPRP